jgi:hypothetical protein
MLTNLNVSDRLYAYLSIKNNLEKNTAKEAVWGKARGDESKETEG